MKTIEYTCQSCGKFCSRPSKGNFFGKFCSNQCQKDLEYKTKTQDWLDGNLQGWTGRARQLRNFVRRYLHETRGTACECCGWDKKHPIDGRVLTEIDHVDGDAENCASENLKVLCPNCHSLTPTFRARNKKSKRQRS